LFSEANNGYIPDLIEKGLYKTLYALILSLLDELFAHMKINIIGDQIHFRLQPGSPNPNSRFFLPSLVSQENGDLCGGGGGVGENGADPLLDQYRQLALEEKRCQSILENIQKKKEVLRLSLVELQGEESVSKSVDELGDYSATAVGSSIFLATVGILIFCLKK
jgi:hypothetical protein